MKNTIILLTILILGAYSCNKNTKRITLHFSDNAANKQIKITSNHYALLTDDYLPSVNNINTNDTVINLLIADTTDFVRLEIGPPYVWSSNVIINTKISKDLDVYFDTILNPRFTGENAEIYNEIYLNKNYLSIVEQLNLLKEPFFAEDNTTLSIFDFVRNIIETKTSNLDVLVTKGRIDSFAYNYAKDVLIDEYLTRVGINGMYERNNYANNIGDSIFFSDLDSLHKHYALKTTTNMRSLHTKAILANYKIIKGSRKDLGLEGSYVYMPEEAQETFFVSEILAQSNRGELDSLNLIEQQSLFKRIFPSSKYLNIINEITIPTPKEYVLATYDDNKKYNEIRMIDIKELSNIGELTQITHPNQPVLIDLWATWCSPCISEFKNTKAQTELKQFLSDNNIGLLYISIDKPGAYDKWKNKINEFKLVGTHYLSTAELYEQFIFLQNYGFIPHYILVDKDGTILKENAERPSSGKLINEITESLNLRCE